MVTRRNQFAPDGLLTTVEEVDYHTAHNEDADEAIRDALISAFDSYRDAEILEGISGEVFFVIRDKGTEEGEQYVQRRVETGGFAEFLKVQRLTEDFNEAFCAWVEFEHLPVTGEGAVVSVRKSADSDQDNG